MLSIFPKGKMPSLEKIPMAENPKCYILKQTTKNYMRSWW
jgi:hypothetical protein